MPRLIAEPNPFPYANGLAFTVDGVPSPVLRFRQGDTLDFELVNHLDEPTTVHWHGLKVDWIHDGHPLFSVAPQESRSIQFQILNRGATYWYHPHAHQRTAFQAYHGMGGALIVDDEDQDRLKDRFSLVPGVTDLVQDRVIDGNLLVYNEGHPLHGFLGDQVMVNGTIKATKKVSATWHRLRLINASNARIYRIALFSEGQMVPFQLIGVDGGLLEQGAEVNEVWLSPAERVELMVDFGHPLMGSRASLQSQDFTELIGPMGGPTIQGHPIHIMDFLVLRKRPVVRPAPNFDGLSVVATPDFTDAPFRNIGLAGQMHFTINGAVFDMNEAPITVTRNSKEIWSITNNTTIPHPMHLHAVPMHVLERRGSPQLIRSQAVDMRGRLPTDLGYQDTVLVWPFEQVRVGVAWEIPFNTEQSYLFHFHNLEHEDRGMMVNVRVTP
ncbi:MAG: multicopper oxidase family protein [Acidobacteria bacterium]|nr:multicopper oxidase family protein [Acidobacteriota bacterium]